MVNKSTSRYLVCQVVIRTVEEKAAGLGPIGYRVSAGVVVSYEVGRKGFPRRTHVSRDLGGERVQPSRDLGNSVPRRGTSSGKSTEVSVLRVGENKKLQAWPSALRERGVAPRSPGSGGGDHIRPQADGALHREKAYGLPRHTFRVFVGKLAEMLTGG